MFLIPLPFVILGAIPFIVIASMVYTQVTEGRKSYRFVWGALFGLAIWTLNVFQSAFSTVLDRSAHTRSMQEQLPAWEKSQVFEDLVQIPIAYIHWVIDHFRVLLTGASAYEREIQSYLERVTWVDGVEFHLWDALPGLWAKLEGAATLLFAEMPVQATAGVIALLLLAYYVPAIVRRKSDMTTYRMLYSWNNREAKRLRQIGAPTEKILEAEAHAQRFKGYLEQPQTLRALLLRRTKSARYVLNPLHRLKHGHLQEIHAKRGLIGTAGHLVLGALKLLVAYLMAVFAVGYVALMLVPYLGAAGPVFGAILGMIFAIGLFGGVLRVGGMNFFFFMRS